LGGPAGSGVNGLTPGPLRLLGQLTPRQATGLPWGELRLLHPLAYPRYVKETRLRGIKHGCRLLRRDVEELISTTCRGIDEKYLSISTEQGNIVTSAKTLAEFEEEAGRPQKLNNLDISVIDFDLDRQVHIRVDSKHAFYLVKGVDSTWTNGRFVELDNILQRTRSRIFLVYETFASMSFSALVWFLIYFHVDLFLRKTLLFIGAGISMLCLVAALVTLTIRASRNFILLQDVSHAPRDTIKVGGLVVAILSLVMSSIQLLIVIRRGG
jgi:hypothetical protein